MNDRKGVSDDDMIDLISVQFNPDVKAQELSNFLVLNVATPFAGRRHTQVIECAYSQKAVLRLPSNFSNIWNIKTLFVV